MALIKCPNCGKEISDKAEKCPECGASFTANSNVEEKMHSAEPSGLRCVSERTLCGA